MKDARNAVETADNLLRICSMLEEASGTETAAGELRN